jgi:hypothetical protein
VLAGVAIQGLRAEGVARRKLEASLLADERLARIELQIEEGNVPVAGEDEEDVDIFHVTTTVEPYEIPVPPPETGSEPTASLLTPKSQLGGEAPVRRIVLRVSWPEGEGEYSVERTTFGLDLLSVSDLLPNTPDAAGAPGAGALGDGALGDGALGRSAGDALRSNGGDF